jgi:histidinol-phosphate aminotransferase
MILASIQSLLNPRVRATPEYDQKHVTICWNNEGAIRRVMSNESSYAPLDSVQQAIRDIASKANWYPEDPTYASRLRQKLADYASVQPENVTLGNGSMELLDLIFMTFIANPGIDEVIMPAPDYSAYAVRGAFFGAKTCHVICGENTDQAAEDMLALMTPHTKFVLLSRPNNPTGKLMPAEDVKRILRTGALTVVDEAYVELASPGTSVATWLFDWDNLIVLRTFSKGFGLAGLRFGYMLARPEIIGYVNRVRHIFNVNLVAMAAAEAALDDLDSARKVFDEIRETRDWLTDQIAQMPGLRPIPSQANFVLVDVSQSGHPATAYVDYLFNHGFFVRDFSKKLGLSPDTFFRITIGYPEDMKRLVMALCAFES